MAYTYDDFLNAANSSGMLAKISESDLSLAKQYPEFGLSILSLTKDLDSATTAEQKLLATEAAEQLRSAYTSYGSGGMGTYDAQINNLLQQAANYGSFNYGKETEYQRLLNSVTNPEQFKYDLDSDIVWDSYRKQYLREGERATADTLAKVSAATGGRPSSYAVTAAHQAGDYYNSQLTDMIPTLYQNAYQRYLNDLGLKQTGLEALTADREAAYNQHMTEYAALLDNLEKLMALQEAEQEQEKHEEPEPAQFNILTHAQQTAQEAAGTNNWNRFQNALAKAMGQTSGVNAGGINLSPGTTAPAGTVDNSSFAGTTYAEGVAYMRTNGVRSNITSDLMTAEEWNKARADGSSPVATAYDTYTEYLNSYVQYAVAMTNKRQNGHEVTTSLGGLAIAQ